MIEESSYHRSCRQTNICCSCGKAENLSPLIRRVYAYQYGVVGGEYHGCRRALKYPQRQKNRDIRREHTQKRYNTESGTPVMNTRLRPVISATRPKGTLMAATDMVKAFTTHPTSAPLTSKSLSMAGMDRLSELPMKVVTKAVIIAALSTAFFSVPPTSSPPIFMTVRAMLLLLHSLLLSAPKVPPRCQI